MSQPGERILIVESDPTVSDLIARQALAPLGYRTSTVRDAASAIPQIMQSPPDLIIASLNLPGLSGKDLLTALTSEGLETQVIVVAKKGQEQSVIQAFRLGAADALFWPVRDAEVVRVVERALQQTRERRARQRLGQQLDATHLELEKKLRELTAIVDIGRAIISVTDQRRLFDRILDGALQVAEADMCWLMVRDERTKNYLLAAQRSLPGPWAGKLNQPLDDGISGLVALSGQPLSIHGGPLEKFRVAALGKAAAVLPLKVQNEVVGLLVVMRKADREVDKPTLTLLEAVADFACISLVNARLFRAVQRSAEAATATERSRQATLASLREAIRESMQVSQARLDALLAGQCGALSKEQAQALGAIQSAWQRLARAVEKTIPTAPIKLR
jgi:two-component system NtrC family sensor kinase